jgi:hypothetical protein
MGISGRTITTCSSIVQPRLHRARSMLNDDFRREVREGTDREGNAAVGADLLQIQPTLEGSAHWIDAAISLSVRGLPWGSPKPVIRRGPATGRVGRLTVNRQTEILSGPD